MSALDRVLTRLPDAKPVGSGWKASCPRGEGIGRNLTVTTGRGGRVRIECMHGCRAQEAAQCIGLSARAEGGAPVRPVDLVLARLPDARWSGSSWRACCPVHHGRRRNLSIHERWGMAVLYCSAGCAWRDIAKSIGLEPRDLWRGRP